MTNPSESTLVSKIKAEVKKTPKPENQPHPPGCDSHPAVGVTIDIYISK